MITFTSNRGFADPVRKLLRFRYFEYPLFILAIFIKIKIFHSNLHALYIDMDLLDDVIALGSILLVSFWTLWLTRRGRTVALCVLNVLLTALFFSDLVYYRYFGDFITVPVLMQAGQVGELGQSIRSMIHASDLRLIADWGVWLVLMLVFALRRHRQNRSLRLGYTFSIPRPAIMKRRRLWPFINGAVVFAAGFAMAVGPVWHYAKTSGAGLFENDWWNLSLYNATGLLGFHYYDASKYIEEHLGRKTVNADKEDEIRQWFQDTEGNRQAQNETFGAYAGSNVIVVQAEAFMNFMIGKQINGQEITPNFNKLMKECLYYSNYYHQTGQGRTSDADFSSQSSLHPLPTGSVFIRYPNHDYDVLPRILKTAGGYRTAAFHAYEGSFWNRTITYKAMGYDRFYDKKDYQIDEPLGWSLGDKSFFRQSLDFMTGEKQPFYSFLITLSSHHPYSLPKRLQTLNTGDFDGTIFGDYLQSIHYVDAALGELVEGMKQDGLWNNTILYFYGDHDDSIPGKVYYEKLLGKPLTDLDMHQIMNQVPLLVHLPDGKQAGVYDEPAGQLDMAPSLLHLLGIPSAPYYMMGNNLFAGSGGRRFVVLRSGAFTDGKLYYIPSPDNRFENGSCYDLGTRDKTDTGQCRVPYEEALKELNFSDTLVTSNLIADFRKKD